MVLTPSRQRTSRHENKGGLVVNIDQLNIWFFLGIFGGFFVLATIVMGIMGWYGDNEDKK